jgi:hypothetical protein
VLLQIPIVPTVSTATVVLAMQAGAANIVAWTLMSARRDLANSEEAAPRLTLPTTHALARLGSQIAQEIKTVVSTSMNVLLSLAKMVPLATMVSTASRVRVFLGSRASCAT